MFTMQIYYKTANFIEVDLIWQKTQYLSRIFDAMSLPIIPYQNSAASKKEQVANMFNRIAGKYDFLNHFLSLGIDRIWRRKAVKEFIELSSNKHAKLLDLATGTGDLALEALSVSPFQITGIDISSNMLELARMKISKAGLAGSIQVQQGDSENLPFQEADFDGVMVGFGVRNFENIEKGLQEMYRVLKPGGKAVVLEFSKPRIFPFRQIYTFYFRFILPFLGKKVSKDDEAYSYLHRSVSAFPDGDAFLILLNHAGFIHTKQRPLSLGICTIYTGFK